MSVRGIAVSRAFRPYSPALTHINEPLLHIVFDSPSGKVGS